MKRNVKYLGSAVAVALLAAGAPVVVPMLMPSTLTEVKADSITNPNASASEMITEFLKQFDNRYVASSDSVTGPLSTLKTDSEAKFLYFDPSKPFHIRDFQNNTQIRGLMDKNNRLSNDYFVTGGDYYYRDILVYMTIADKNGTNIDISTADKIGEVAEKINDGSFPLTIGVHVRQSTDSADGTYNPPSVPKPLDKYFTMGLSQFDVTTDSTTPSVHTGTTLSDSDLTKNNSLSIDDNYKGDKKYTASMTAAQKPNYGQSLFTTKESALAYAESSSFDPKSAKSGNVTAEQFKDNLVIEKPGTYYQTVSYDLKGDGSNKTDPVGADQAIGYMISGKPDPLIDNGKVDVYKTFINGQESTDYSFNQATGTLTIARPIIVGTNVTANLTTPTVNTGSATSDVGTTDISLVDGSDTIPTSSISPADDTYYTDPAATTPATSDEVSGGKFLKAGKYYRKLIFTLASGKTSDYNFSGNITDDTKDTTVTYIQEVDVKNNTTPTITTPTPKIGDNVSTATSGNDLKNNDAGSLLDTTKGDYKGVSFGDKYYKVDPTDANKAAILADPTKNITDGVVSSDGTTFAKQGSYLRTITFYLTKDEIANNVFDTVDPNVKVSVDNSTVTYVQQIKISGVNIAPNVDNPTVAMGTKTSDNKLTTTTSSFVDGNTSLLNTTKGINGIELGKTYYDDPQLSTETKDITKDNRLNKAKSYYRTIKFYLTDDAFSKYSYPGSYGEPDDTEKSVTYVQSVTVTPAGTATFVNKGLTVVAGTKLDGTATDGTKLTDTTVYTLSDDNDSKNSIIANNGISLGNYYASESDAKANKNPLAITSFEPNKPYYRTITIKVNPGDGYAYTYPDASSVDKDNDTVTYIQAIKVNQDLANVSVGSINTTSGSATSTLDKDFTDDSVKNSMGSIVATDGISFGTDYYDEAADALKGDTSKKTAKVTADGQIIGTGALYRTITFTLEPGEGVQNTFNPGTLGTDYTVDGDKVTYVQTINVTAVAATATINPVNGIQAGTETSDSEKFENSDVTVNGTSIFNKSGKVTYGTTYYDSIEDFKNKKPTVDIGKDSTFAAVHPYYREVTIPLTKNSASAYDFSGDNFVSVDKVHDTATFLQEVKVQFEPTQSNIADIHPQLKTGVPIADSTLNDTTGYIVTDSTGSIIADGDNSIQFGTDYYANAQDALDETNKITGTVFSDGIFLQEGPFYRTVTISLKPGATDRDVFNVKVNGVEPKLNGSKSVTYVQLIDVEQNEATAKIVSSSSNVYSSVIDVPESTGNTLIDENGKSVIAADGIQFDKSGKFYDSLADYKDNIDNKSKRIVDGKFTEAGTYYRAITFKLKPSVATADQFSGDDLAGTDTDNNTVTYLQPVNVGVNTATADIRGIETTTATPSNDTSLENANGSDITSKYQSTDYGSIVADNGISYGETYYDTEADLFNGTVSKRVSNNRFHKSGDYYRAITFKVKDHALLGNTLNETPKYKLNDDGSVTYAQLVTVNSVTVKPTISSAIADAETSVNAEQNSSKNDIEDASEHSLVKDIDYGTIYYADNSDPAKVLGGTADVVTGVVQGDTYVKTGTYYRTITFNLNSDALDANALAGTPTHKLSDDKTKVTYVQKITINPVSAQVTVSPITTKVGETLDDTTTADTLNRTDTDKTPISAKVTLGKLYKSSPSALNSTSGDEVTDAVSGGKFVKAGTYYRLVTFTPAAGTLDGYKFADTNAHVNSNGTVTYVTYVQKIKVNAYQVTPTTTKTVSVIAGSSVSNEQKSEKNDVIDSSENSIVNKAVFGNYYSDSTDALNKSANHIVSGVTNGDVYAKPGTYYRSVTFNLKDDGLDGNSFDPTLFKVDEVAKTATFVQTITINKIPAKVTTSDVSAKVGDAITSLPNADGYTLNNTDNNDVIPAKAVANTKIYKNKDLTGQVTGDKFETAGTYYRAITFTPTNPADYYNVSGVTANTDGTFTYVQTINVGKADSKATSWTDNSKQGNNVQNLNVEVSVGADDTNLSNTASYDLTDSTSSPAKSLVDKKTNNGVSFDSNYYSVNKDGSVGAKSDYATGYKILRPGVYARQVTFSLLSGAFENYDFSKLPGYVKSDANSVTFDQIITANALTANDSIKDAAANTGSSLTTDTLQNPKDVTLTGKDGKTIVANNPTFDGLFDTKADAISNGTKATDAVDKNGNLVKAGTYYQRVTIPLSDNADYAYNLASLGGIVDHDKNTVTFVRAVTISLKPSSGSSTGSNTGSDSGGSDDDWTYHYDTKGVVTTKTEQPSYSLNDQANKTIDNRNLAENTSWLTDEYRTNHEGVKQYRVATGEWIDSNDVYFNQTGNNNDDDWTYYNNRGVVTTKEEQPSYSMNDQANKTIENRNLAEDTSWLTDEYRTNREGVKQYRVATGEWIDSHDVILEGQNDNNDDWTYYNNHGVVTTKQDQNYYSINNQANKTIANRDLSERTSWLTDEYRTNREGVKQYRVATGEWIDTHDVIFVKDVKQVVNLDETSNFYDLYDFEEQLVSNRALSEKTSWRVDKMATDADGNIYYRVATNEWVKQIKGVHLDNSAWY